MNGFLPSSVSKYTIENFAGIEVHVDGKGRGLRKNKGELKGRSMRSEGREEWIVRRGSFYRSPTKMMPGLFRLQQNPSEAIMLGRRGEMQGRRKGELSEDIGERGGETPKE